MAKLKTATTIDRIRYIGRMTGMKQDAIKKVLDASYLFDANSIAEGKRVVCGNFYSLYPKFVKEHTKYNPLLGKNGTIKEHTTLKASSFSGMKDALDIATRTLKEEQ